MRAGYSFLQALDTVSKEIGEPSATEFQRVVAEIRLGRPIDEALTAMAIRVQSDDLKWAVIAINVQRQVGGNLAEVLDIVANTVRERAYIRSPSQVLGRGAGIGRDPGGAPISCFYISIVNPIREAPCSRPTSGLPHACRSRLIRASDLHHDEDHEDRCLALARSRASSAPSLTIFLIGVIVDMPSERNRPMALLESQIGTVRLRRPAPRGAGGLRCRPHLPAGRKGWGASSGSRRST
jgi:hypothetical protein